MTDTKNSHNDPNQFLKCIRSQLSELDLLLSMYPDQSELVIDDFTAVDELRRIVDEPAFDEFNDSSALDCNWRIGFTFRVLIRSETVGETSSSKPRSLVDCICRLPGAYPDQKPPGLFLRSDWLSRSRLRLVSEALANQLEETFALGEPVLYQMLSWLTDFVSTKFPASSLLQDDHVEHSESTSANAAKLADHQLCRLWIHSHHIYNSLKRRDILNWSAELRLTGFSIVGKPGVVCVEGPDFAVDEFWQRLRRLNWKKLTIKEKDLCPADSNSRQSFCKFNDFRELAFNARPGRGREVLQDWGLVIRFLEDKGLGHVIPVYFGNLTAK